MIMFNTATSEQFLLSFGDLVLLTSTGLSTPKYRGTAFGAVNVPSVASSLVRRFSCCELWCYD